LRTLPGDPFTLTLTTVFCFFAAFLDFFADFPPITYFTEIPIKLKLALELNAVDGEMQTVTAIVIGFTGGAVEHCAFGGHLPGYDSEVNAGCEVRKSASLVAAIIDLQHRFAVVVKRRSRRQHQQHQN
jgi:hypothetical protein